MVRYATIGTGWITEAFIKAASRVDGLRLTAVYSRNNEKARSFALKHNAKLAFTDIEDMASSQEIDAVYIASPNLLHFEQSMLFLKHKKHVICEKPVALSKEQAELMISTAHENGVIFMEAIMSLHTPQLDIVKRAVNEIGKISLIRIDYSQLSSKYPLLLSGENPNIFNIDMKTGCIMDIGIYCVYLLLALFPNYSNVVSSAVRLPSTLDLCGTSTFLYDDMLAVLTYSKIADTAVATEIQGSEGTITIERVSVLERISLVKKVGAATTTVLFEESADTLPMQYEAQSFYNYITGIGMSKYSYLNKLCIDVADTLKTIREKSGVSF